MAHFARVENGIVRQVIVAEQEYIDNLVSLEPGEWIETSYNTIGGVHSENGTPLRKNYAGVGFTYDSSRDAFIPQQPYDSWTLNETSCIWEPPITKPDGYYRWDEDAYQADNTAGWVAVSGAV